MQHGGTPNLSAHIRAIPSPGSYLAPWFHPPEPVVRTLPRTVWERLSPAGQRITRAIVREGGSLEEEAEEEEENLPGWAPDWEGTEGGGSVDNQLHKGTVVDDPWNPALVRVSDG